MAHKERIQILNSVEESDLYAPPIFSEADQRFFFSFNKIELSSIKRLNSRQHQCTFAVLLGYFKSKPVPLMPKYRAIKHDIQYVAEKIITPGKGVRPFNLESKPITRLYQKIFNLLECSGPQKLDTCVRNNQSI